MMEDVRSSWVDDLLQQCARWNIVFVQLGMAYPTTRQSVAPYMESVVSASDYISRGEIAGKLRLVTDVELLIEPGAPSLGQLRERVIADRDNGVQVVLMSRRPKIAFPIVPGSQVLRDAKLIQPPVYRSGECWQFGDEALTEGVPFEAVLEGALRELGEVACAELDAFLFEDGRGLQDLPSAMDPLLEALLGAGLAANTDRGCEWALTEGPSRVKTALANVVAGVKRPAESFGDVATNCWVSERLVKRAVRARARTLWGSDWRSELLGPELAEVALERAIVGSYAGADRLEDIRDPLEWLTLGEALTLRDSSEIGSLGINPQMWSLLRLELLPVKDRVERSQLIRRGDADIALRWAELLTQRLSTSGTRSPGDSVALVSGTQRQVFERLRGELAANSQLRGDIEKDFMSLVLATIKFLSHVLDSRPDYVASIPVGGTAPLERVLQDAFKAYLDMSDLAGRAAVEASKVGGGRADVVLYCNDGVRYVTEVKREFHDSTLQALEANYLPQTIAYQSANVPFGQLLVLDLTESRDVALDRLDQSIWVSHKRGAEDEVISSTLVAVVRGNRPFPSARKQ